MSQLPKSEEKYNKSNSIIHFLEKFYSVLYFKMFQEEIIEGFFLCLKRGWLAKCFLEHFVLVSREYKCKCLKLENADLKTSIRV